MRNHLFLTIYIIYLDFFLPEIGVFGGLKQKKATGSLGADTQYMNDSLSYIRKKRRECENNHHNGMNTTPEQYIYWPEITELNQKEFCDKFVSKLFVRNHKTVESVIIVPTIWLYYTEILNTMHKQLDPVNVKALRCTITPSCYHYKSIYFIKSFNYDCLYMLNSLNIRTKKFYIAGEVCLIGEYKFREIRGLKRYGKRVICKNDTVDERRQYETDHFKSFKLKPEKYKLWPLLKEDEVNAFCRGLMRKLLPGHEYSRVDSMIYETMLQYREILKWNDGALLRFDVGAVDCEIPGKKQRKSYQFVKAATYGCVYLVTPVDPNCTTYYIAKQICGNEVYMTGSEISQYFDDELKTFSIDTDIINLLNEDDKNEEMEVTSVDQNLIEVI